MNNFIKKNIWYFVFIALATIVSILTRHIPIIQEIFTQREQSIYLVLAILFSVGYGLHIFAPKTMIPSFVWAIFFGIAMQPILTLLVNDPHTLKVMIELLAALVLFAGGVDVPFKNFQKYFAPIASLAIGGTLLTIFLFGTSLDFLGNFFISEIPPISFLIMAAILSSTDPTAIIPSLKQIRLKRPFLRDIIVSESAVNDVVGSILTRFFLIVILATAGTQSINALFTPIFNRNSVEALLLEVAWGASIGLFSAWLLKKWSTRLNADDKERKANPALFFAIPIFAFAGGSLIGGSGFLAAFLAGLLFDKNEKTKQAYHFFEIFVDDFIKPIIFILVGALVPVAILFENALFGILAGLIFIIIIRPIIVFFTLWPWSIKSKERIFSINDLLFISFIRETGVIPAVLMLVAVSSGLPFPDQIFAIGMWVILVTLIIEPPLIPTVAKKLGLLKK